MRIKCLTFKNYRQYKDLHMVFPKGNTDLQVIIGKNGAGKTNILNGINWCLYGEEPHLAKESQALPILNLKTIDESTHFQRQHIIVEVILELDGKEIAFSRKGEYIVYKDNQEPSYVKTDFEVRIMDDIGNTKILSSEEANEYVERFVPKNIREFFFFDGERLDNYFKDATGQAIRGSVFEISRIELLNRVENRLKTILGEITKEAGKYNPAIEEKRKKLEEKEGSLNEIKNELMEHNKQIGIAKEALKEVEDNLRKVPDVDKYIEKQKEFLNQKKFKLGLRTEKIKEKQDILFERGIIIMLWPAIQRALQLIEDKRNRKEIPPNVPKDLLEKAINENLCVLCGRMFDDIARQRIAEMMSEIKLSSEIAQELLRTETILRGYAEKAMRFRDDIKKVTREIENYDRDLERIQHEINEIDELLGKFDVQKVQEWQRKRKSLEKALEDSQKRLGVLEDQKEKLEEEIKFLKKELESELRKEDSVRKLQKQLNFCEKALEAVKKVKNNIINQTKQTIEVKTRDLFLSLIWKSATFADVRIDENYNIQLIHKMGYDCLGSMSAGERELLALSFTLSLHEVSGYDSPIIIDTPVARISDEHRENFAQIFAKVSKDKQTILLFTPSEFSEDVSTVLNRVACSKYSIVMSSDEKEAKMEVF